eukprot:CAMPEP_0118870220 /NCGR_PEP_ID=MMETSP1163-20130328/13272_1 /TAXON_ID=124430 /ORGANISM="Phaeomonas parva, Strain CCMP2877" /LENGTH=80 /DNA_ID=CAMNT_0006805193 /DNA_START=348 /DNA_END=587 /DNA_ORIENTATION=-
MGEKLSRLSAIYHGVEATAAAAHGAASFDGSRMCNEDAYMTFVSPGVSWALFGVFDGHGGVEMAARCADYFPLFLWQRSG